VSQGTRPIYVGDMELSAPALVGSVGPQTHVRYEYGRILIRLHGVPLGFIELSLPDGHVDPARVRREAYRQLGGSIHRHLWRDGLSVTEEVAPQGPAGKEICRDAAETSWHEPLTVVVCSRDRPAQLAMCLNQLRQLRYDAFEVVVVDNAPSDDEPAKTFRNVVGDDPRFRYVMEPRPGLSRARNRGVAEASFAHVAFTDDDVLVDPLWLEGVARGFSRDRKAGCVTGLIPSAQLDTQFQRYFDQRVWWSSRVEPHVYDLAETAGESRLFPFDAGRIGTGANFAVDRELIERIGGFDQALGAGSPTRGGEDLDAFVRVLRAGRSIVYEPSAIVWHLHRAAFEELRRQLYGFGMGLSAYVTKYLADPTTRWQLLKRIPPGVLHMLSLWGRGEGGSHSSLVLAEARGMMAGPFAYRRARRSAWHGLD
jgi:GT2 family glycosyltransferase